MAEDKTIWSVGGGKGGVGKSVATANIGCALAATGRKVVLVDADLGGANLHTCFGITFPERGLDDFIQGRVKTLDDAAIPTAQPNLRLICGAGEFLGIANPTSDRKHRLLRHIKRFKADYIIVDLGAGAYFSVLDFFAISDEGIIVLVPDPAALQNAYMFLKGFVYRRLERLFAGDAGMLALVRDATDAKSPNGVRSFSDLCGRLGAKDASAAEKAEKEIGAYHPKLLLNMAVTAGDERAVDAFIAAAKTFLGIEAEPAGVLYSRPSVAAAARKMLPFMLDPEAKDAHADVNAVVKRLLSTKRAREDAPAPGARQGPDQSVPDASGALQEVFGFNDNVEHGGAVYHVQTEVQGGAPRWIETIIYHGGRIFFSKRTPWEESGSPRDFAHRQHRAAMAAVRMDKIDLNG